MDDQATRVAKTFKPVTEQALRRLGGTVDEAEVWTFQDGSKGKMTERPIAFYSDPEQTKRLGFIYFEKLDSIQ